MALDADVKVRGEWVAKSGRGWATQRGDWAPEESQKGRDSPDVHTLVLCLGITVNFLNYYNEQDIGKYMFGDWLLGELLLSVNDPLCEVAFSQPFKGNLTLPLIILATLTSLGLL